MALTPHKVYVSNGTGSAGHTPANFILPDGFTGRTITGPATLTRAVLDIEIFEGTTSTANFYDTPLQLFLEWQYIIAWTVSSAGTIPPFPQDNPLFDAANDILHTGMLYKTSEVNKGALKPTERPIVIDVQRKVAAGEWGGLFFAANNNIADTAVQMAVQVAGVIIYLA